MPKEGRERRSSSCNQSRSSPYPRSSKNVDRSKSKTQLLQVGHEKEWEEARCPVCIEHPHNAVLLICSSHDKGCRPYMCDTSYRHSNCLDQFRKSPVDAPSADLLEPIPVTTAPNRRANQSASFGHRECARLVCPLCRGQISHWVAIEPARRFMNFKPRSCSLETCDFVGNYSELRKHARREHPYVRPMEVDPTRQLDWDRSERQTAFQDFLSAMEFGDDSGENSLFPTPDWPWMDVSASVEYLEDEPGEGSSSPIGYFESSSTYVFEVDVNNHRQSTILGYQLQIITLLMAARSALP